MSPIRIQIACCDRLIAEVIVENLAEADKLWSRFSILKYKRDLPFGCAVFTRANIPKMWNIRVGRRIPRLLSNITLSEFY